MEIRARYVLVGLFTLAVIIGGFAFVYWLQTSGSMGKRTSYEVRFHNTVSGLLTGSSVLFNGIRVGEVTALKLVPGEPRLSTPPSPSMRTRRFGPIHKPRLSSKASPVSQWSPLPAARQARPRQMQPRASFPGSMLARLLARR